MRLIFCALLISVLCFNESEASDEKKSSPGRKSPREAGEKTKFVYTPSPVASWSPIYHSVPVQNQADYMRGIRPVAPPSAIHLSSAELSRLVSGAKIDRRPHSYGTSSEKTIKNRQLDKFDQRNLPEAPIIPQAIDRTAKKMVPKRSGSLTQQDARELTDMMNEAKMEVRRLPYGGPVEVPQQGHLQDIRKVDNEQHLGDNVRLHPYDHYNHHIATPAYHAIPLEYNDQFGQQSPLPEHALQDYIPEGVPTDKSQHNHYQWGHPGGSNSGSQS